MSDHQPKTPVREKARYETPTLERFGAAAELTNARSLMGLMDGGNMGFMRRTG